MGALSRDEYEMTADEVAVVLGISRQRVHQIEAEALEKLRAICAARGITAPDFYDVVKP